jgi:hypothetical protein
MIQGYLLELCFFCRYRHECLTSSAMWFGLTEAMWLSSYCLVWFGGPQGAHQGCSPWSPSSIIAHVWLTFAHVLDVTSWDGKRICHTYTSIFWTEQLVQYLSALKLFNLKCLFYAYLFTLKPIHFLSHEHFIWKYIIFSVICPSFRSLLVTPLCPIPQIKSGHKKAT